jgi:hypothetical protein
VELTSFNKVQPGTLDFLLAWSRQDAKKANVERALRLGLCVNLEDDEGDDEDDAGPSQWHGGDGGQGYSTWVSKDEPPSDDNDSGTKYVIFYQRLGMN